MTARLLLAALVALTSAAAAQAVTLRWTGDGDALSMDPHGHNEAFTLSTMGNVYETLAPRGKNLDNVPGLAESWRNVDPLTWEFKLRRGVKFHDGSDFTADDVVFSWQRSIRQDSEMRAYFISVEKVEAKDRYTIVMKTREPNPILIRDLSVFYIASKAWADKNKIVDVTSLSKAQENFATRNANGTGPYILTSRQADVKTTFKRNPDWWGWKAGAGASNVDDVVLTPIKQDGTRVAALLSGEIDMVYAVPVQDIDRIKAGGYKVYQIPETRTIFLGMDQSRAELLESDVKGKNPLKDLRVRKAMYQAIDVNSIVTRVMRGAAATANAMVVDFVTGYDPGFKRYPFDPDAAKKLLAEAGYPNGFSVGFDCPNDRYVNDAQICQAVTSMWARVGINAKLNAQTKSLYFAKILKRETSVYMLGWTPATIDGLNALDNLLYTPDDKSGKGRFNLGTYSNKKMDQLTEAARTEFDQKKRTKMLQDALNMAHADVGTIPLHYQQVIWASRPNVDLHQLATNTFNWYWVNIK